jgi:hypothetical protein
MKVSGMKWLWLSTAMVASAACSSATETQVDSANATAPDRVQSMLGGEDAGDDFWSDLCQTDEATGDTTCTLNDGNGTECGVTYNADGVITEQGCEGPWGSYNCTADEEALTCDLAMGNLPGCTETFDLESLELLDSNCDFEELFPERPDHGEDGDHEGPGHGDWDDEDEDGRPDHGDWGDDHDNAPDFECFEECEELAMAVEEECRDAERPRECFEANREEVEACFDGCHDAAGPDHGDWDDEDGHWDDEDGEWGDEEECEEPDFGPGHDNACFEGCEDLIEATEEECRNAENPRECFEAARVDVEACFEACYAEDRPDHGDDWGHGEEGEEGDWGHPDRPDHGDDGHWGEPDWACIDTCEELAYAVEEECYASEDPRACFEARGEEVEACFEACRPEPVEGEEGEWDFPEEPDHGDHGDDWGFPDHGDHGDHWGEPEEGAFPEGPDAACFEACEELIDIVEEECRGSERPYECFESYRADVDACFEGCRPEGAPEIPGGF